MTTAGPLTVDFCGEIHEVDEQDAFTFGRLADLSIDDNPYMHRVLGRFEARHGRWWVVNLGSTIVLEIFDRTSHSKASLTPGSDQALPGSNVVVRFAAGPTVYEVDVRSVPQEKQAEDDHGGLEMGLASQTIRASDLPMTESQLLLVLSLAESKLREPQLPLDIPPTKQAAARLGWTTSKFNRKLDNVCEKMTRQGVKGLKSGAGDVATDRRRRLVEHSVSVGVVDASMLEMLDELQP